MVVEQAFDVHIISGVIASEWRRTPFQVEVMRTLAQYGIDGRRGDFADTQNHVWIGLRKLLNQVWQERGHGRRRKADPYLPERWVIQKFNVFDALPQFIEHGSCTLEQRLSVQGELDTAWTAVEQPRIQC